MKKFTVELIEDEDLPEEETPEELSCKIKFNHAGIAFCFEFPNAHFFTAEDVRKFASEPSGSLIFEDRNGVVGIFKKDGKVTFTCSRMCTDLSVTLDAAECDDLFLELASQLATTDVKPLQLFRDIDAEKVYFKIENKIPCIAWVIKGRGEYCMTLHGFDASHIPALTSIVKGESVEIECPNLESAGVFRMITMGTHLRSDGHWLLIGPPAKSALDILPDRFVRQDCNMFLVGLINYLKK